MKKKISLLVMTIAAASLIVAGCGESKSIIRNPQARVPSEITTTETSETTSEETVPETETTTETEPETEAETPFTIQTETGAVEVGINDGILTFVDAHENIYEVEVHQDWPMNDYDPSAFKLDGYKMSYNGDDYDYRLGIDVYGNHGDIDWQAVKDDGYDFAILRCGYRGYQYPALVEDEKVVENIKGCLEAGLDVGIYFFSQAIIEWEAVEEAEFVLSILEENDIYPEDLTLGIIFDPESILDDEARTDDVTGEQFTLNSIAFCERILEAGYDTMIYANMVWEATLLDLGDLSDYDFWYADYNKRPQTPYAYTIWQYGHAMVDGVSAQVDANIQLIPKK